MWILLTFRLAELEKEIVLFGCDPCKVQEASGQASLVPLINSTLY